MARIDNSVDILMVGVRGMQKRHLSGFLQLSCMGSVRAALGIISSNIPTRLSQKDIISSVKFWQLWRKRAGSMSEHDSAEEKIKMKKRIHSLASIWLLCLGILLCPLASCSNTSPSFTPTRTPNATQQMATITALAQATADPILNLVGTYAGTYRWRGSSSLSPMRLEITQEEGVSLSGECLLGQQRLPFLHAVTSPAYGGGDGLITFMLDLPASQGQQAISLNFQGT